MTRKDGAQLYAADEGKMFVRRSDGLIMGNGLDLGVLDNIDNYEERAFSEEETAAFLKSVGADVPRKPVDRKEARHDA